MSTAGLALHSAQRDWKDLLLPVLKPVGLSLRAYLLLSAVYWSTRETNALPSQAEAARRAGLDMNVASQTARFLASHHLIRKEISEHDSRAFTLALTLAGEQLLRRAEEAVQPVESAFFQPVHLPHLTEALMSLTNKVA